MTETARKPLSFEQQLERLFEDVSIAKAVWSAHPEADMAAALEHVLNEADERRGASQPEPPTINQVRALIVAWRARFTAYTDFHATMGTGYRACADELEALIVSSDSASSSMSTKT